MRDEQCVAFLQWVLPQLHMRWPGFRKVRGQVCKRLQRRIRQLGLESVGDYRRYLLQDPAEWKALDALTRVTVSRFYRDKMVFRYLAEAVLPTLAQQALTRGRDRLLVWSAGAGAGEEPHTLSVVWHLQLQPRFPCLRLRVIATDADAHMCRRAEQACYPYSSIKNLPAEWRDRVFTRQADCYCLKAAYRHDVDFRVQDIRQATPAERFDLLLCRNLVFTYFAEELQRRLLERMKTRMNAGGALVIGIHEALPSRVEGFGVWSERLRVFRRE
ncbi:MAG: CheR family methyltransferase [Gammaproteobacteria bacterium]